MELDVLAWIVQPAKISGYCFVMAVEDIIVHAAPGAYRQSARSKSPSSERNGMCPRPDAYNAVLSFSSPSMGIWGIFWKFKSIALSDVMQ